MFPCGRRSWVCTTEAAYWAFIYGPKSEYPALYPQTTAPPPGECWLITRACQFTASVPNCKTWVDPLNGNKCGSVSEYVTFTNKQGSLVPKGFGQYPAPNQLYLPINNTCDPCLYWRGFCTTASICGSTSTDKYYTFMYGPRPSCTPPTPAVIPHVPLGQCAISKDYCNYYGRPVMLWSKTFFSNIIIYVADY